jgi:transcriptional regulator GlxA family with amidase domain
MTRAIEILAFPAAQLLDVCGPLQVFATANDLAGDAGAPRPYAAAVVAAGGVSVMSSAGLGLATRPLPPADAPLDTLILPGGAGTEAACRDATIMAWVAARAVHARRVASVCTGAFLLAEAGLLDGRRAATHWAHCDELAARYPKVVVEADPIFVRDGAIWTSAGVTAGIDLALTLVEHDLGRATALAVARQLVVFLKRPGGQSQFSVTLSAQRAAGRFEALHDWMSRHLAADLSVAVLARQAGMSERGFARHYRAETGLTPARAVERFRVEAARLLLADTTTPMKRIAAQCGFGSEEGMRRSFSRLIATTPGDYRQRFSVGA